MFLKVAVKAIEAVKIDIFHGCANFAKLNMALCSKFPPPQVLGQKGSIVELVSKAISECLQPFDDGEKLYLVESVV